jgi:hypothetical protein
MNDGGPAFPDGFHSDVPGMTLRDYFAAKAMTAILSFAATNDNLKVSGKPVGQFDENTLAKMSYLTADAMLKAREQ